MSYEDETYGIIGNCFTISNAIIYEKSKLKKIPEDICESRLPKGGNADCHFINNDAKIIELIHDNNIFITNFVGFLTYEKETRNIIGTFIVQLNNDSLKIGIQFNDLKVKNDCVIS